MEILSCLHKFEQLHKMEFFVRSKWLPLDSFRRSQVRSPVWQIERYLALSGDPSLLSATTVFSEKPSLQRGRSPYDSCKKCLIILFGTNCFKHGVVQGQASCVRAMNKYANSRRRTSDFGRNSETEISGPNNYSNNRIIYTILNVF